MTQIYIFFVCRYASIKFFSDIPESEVFSKDVDSPHLNHAIQHRQDSIQVTKG